MIEWMLVIFLAGGADFEVWGGYTNLDSCERMIAQLENKYAKKGQRLHARCWPVTATFRDSRPMIRP